MVTEIFIGSAKDIPAKVDYFAGLGREIIGIDNPYTNVFLFTFVGANHNGYILMEDSDKILTEDGLDFLYLE